MSYYLGLDSSTQSLTAIVLDAADDRREVVFESALRFDDALPEYGTRYGVLPSRDPSVSVSPPLMWAAALDLMLERISQAVDVARIAAISGSAQQHGSVYMNGTAAGALAGLDSARPIAEQLASSLSRAVAPIWMDSSTSRECAELTDAVGGADVLLRTTGSCAFERFTGAQIKKFSKDQPLAYAATERIHLVSSFMASLLAGRHAAIDTGDASGTNLMDLRSGAWWPPALDAAAPALAAKLPPIVQPWTVLGRLSPYWQTRHRFPAARLVAWSGDNPCSLIGTGLVRQGVVAISLGTSDTIFGPMAEPTVDPSGSSHVFASPTGQFMGLTCFRNGSLARERVRDLFGLTWEGFSRTLDATAAGNDGRLLLPWFEPEITPRVSAPGIRRHNLQPDDGPGHVRGIVEAQQMALAIHSRWMNVDVRSIYATGGAAANEAILQVMADVFGADVYRFEVGNSACLGAALRAWHADLLADGRPRSWDDVVAGIATPRSDSVRPDAEHHARYLELMKIYERFETDALRSDG